MQIQFLQTTLTAWKVAKYVSLIAPTKFFIYMPRILWQHFVLEINAAFNVTPSYKVAAWQNLLPLPPPQPPVG